MNDIVGWYAGLTRHGEPCDTWEGGMEETIHEAGQLIAEIAHALARDEYQCGAPLKVNTAYATWGT